MNSGSSGEREGLNFWWTGVNDEVLFPRGTTISLLSIVMASLLPSSSTWRNTSGGAGRDLENDYLVEQGIPFSVDLAFLSFPSLGLNSQQTSLQPGGSQLRGESTFFISSSIVPLLHADWKIAKKREREAEVQGEEGKRPRTFFIPTIHRTPPPPPPLSSRKEEEEEQSGKREPVFEKSGYIGDECKKL